MCEEYSRRGPPAIELDGVDTLARRSLTTEAGIPDICFVTTCMGRLEHLRQTLGHAAAQGGGSCVVVDYSCPEGGGEWVEAHLPDVKVVRVEGEPRFNLSRARNLGAAAADAPWLCFFDADIALAPTFSDVVRPALRERNFYSAEPWSQGLGGTVVCSRADFDLAGGYDEIMQGWGAEDLDLYARLRLAGARERGFPARLLTQLTHGDDLRVRFYDVKDIALSEKINRAYLHAKLDLMKSSPGPLSVAVRSRLYEDVRRSMT